MGLVLLAKKSLVIDRDGDVSLPWVSRSAVEAGSC